MKFIKIKTAMGVVTYTLKKYSPQIYLGLGMTGVVGATILACTATLKAEAILDEAAVEIEKIDECVTLRETGGLAVEYSEKDEKHDRRLVVYTTTGKFIRLYGPSATLMLASLGCILVSYRIMAERNVALMAAYKVMEEAFSNYRKRVTAELGEQADVNFLYGREPVEGETRKVTDADGKEYELNPVLNHLSGFARTFESDSPDQIGGWTGSTQWCKIHDYNLSFLNSKMNHFNNMLLSKGFVTINDVYSELGFPTTEAGMICGWRYKSDRGDGYISFIPRGLDGNWAYGQDGCSIILDFNIDGVIFDQDVARREMK